VARYNHTRNNFLAGEVSPKFHGRSDAEEFTKGLEVCENALIFPQGGCGKRPGTQFAFSAVAYTAAPATAVTPTIADTSRLIGVNIMGSGFVLVLTGYASATDLGIAVYNTVTGAFLTLGNVGGLLGTTFAAAKLADVQYAAVGTSVFLTHPEYFPLIVTINSAGTVYALTSYGQGVQAPFDTTYTYSGVGLTLSASGTYDYTITAASAMFSAASINEQFEFVDLDNGNGGVLIVKAYTSGTVVEADVYQTGMGNAFALEATAYGTGTTYFYRFCSWGPSRGFPRTVCFFKNRAVFGGSTTYPNRLWSTKSGDFNVMIEPYGSGSPIVATEVTAASPSALDIAASEGGVINFLVSGKNMTVGTSGREYVVTSVDPTDPQVDPESSTGSAYGAAFRVNSGVVFKQRSKQKLMYLQYNFNEDAFKPADLNVLGEHIFKYSHKYFATFSAPEIKDMSYQSGEEQCIWVVDNNGALFSLTFSLELGVMAWARHIVGGLLGTTQSKVISMTVAHNSTTGHDDVWLLVKRTVNSATVYHAEKIGQNFYLDDLYNTATTLQYKPVYCDSSKLVRLGSPGTTFTGLSHLEGQTVQVLADGNYIGTKVISSGNLVLTRNYTEVIVGLPYTMKVKPLLAEPGSVIGSGMGAIRRIDRAVVKFFNTVGAKIGAVYGTEQGLEFRPLTLDMDEEIPLFSGVKVVEFDGDYDREANIVLTQELPLPCNVNYIATRGLLYD
jgi:hypothetical protein